MNKSDADRPSGYYWVRITAGSRWDVSYWSSPSQEWFHIETFKQKFGGGVGGVREVGEPVIFQPTMFDSALGGQLQIQAAQVGTDSLSRKTNAQMFQIIRDYLSDNSNRWLAKNLKKRARDKRVHKGLEA